MHGRTLAGSTQTPGRTRRFSSQALLIPPEWNEQSKAARSRPGKEQTMCKVIQRLAVKAAIVLALVMNPCIGTALAQSFTLASQHLRDAEVAPLPAVLHPRTRQVLVGVRGGVRKM